MSTTATKTPAVGDGVSICYWSDRHAGTIIHVSPSGKRIVVQRDVAIRTDSNGMSDDQRYEYLRNTKGATYTFTLRKNGRWVQVGEEMRDGTSCLTSGRYEFYDYSF